MAIVVRLLLCIAVLCLGSCKTDRPKDEVLIAVDPNVAPISDDSPGGARGAGTAKQDPSILGEHLDPVRGGAVMLPPYNGPEPCKMALRGDSPVAQACSKRGQKGALDLMQLFVKRARAEGIIFECTDCHQDEDDYTKLLPQADANFRKLLFLARPED